MNDFDDFIRTLSSLGETEVREKLSQGVWSSRRKSWAENWLSDLETARANTLADTELALSKEANEIARSSLAVARSAKTIALAAVILSVVTALAVALVQWLGQK